MKSTFRFSWTERWRKRFTLNLTAWWMPWLFLGILLVALAALVAFNRWWLLHTARPWNFLFPWAGLRAWLFQGQDPYSLQVVQAMTRAWPALGALPSTGVQPPPLWSYVAYFPLALIPDAPLAYALWVTGQQLALGLWVARWLQGSPRRGWLALVLVLLALAWPATWMAWTTGRPTLWVIVAMALAWTAFLEGRDQRAGIWLMAVWLDLLDFAFPLVAWFLWALGRGRRDGPVTWLVASLGLAGLVGWLRPSWWQAYWLALERLWPQGFWGEPALAQALARVFPGLGTRVGLAATAGVLLWMLWQWGRAWMAPVRMAFWSWLWTLALVPWMAWTPHLELLLALLPGVFLTLVLWLHRWSPGHPVWITVVALLWGSAWALARRAAQGADGSPALLTLVPFTLLLLGWTRWWLRRLPLPWME